MPWWKLLLPGITRRGIQDKGPDPDQTTAAIIATMKMLNYLENYFAH